MPKLILKRPKAVKEEGTIYVTAGGKLFTAPKIDATEIQKILDNKYVREGLDKQQRILFQDDITYRVIDLATGETDPDLTEQLEDMCKEKEVNFDFQLQRAWRDSQEWGCGLLSPGWDYDGAEYRLTKINRLPPESFQWRGTTQALIFNRILKGICMNSKTEETEFWQKQADGAILRLDNIEMLTDPLSGELGGTPFIIPVFPYIKMASYAWQRQMQKVNQWGSGGMWTIKVTDPQGDDKEYAQKFLNNQSSTNKFQLRPNMEVVNFGITDNGSALETINEIGMQIRRFFTPSDVLEKQNATLIGGSNNAEFDLYMSYIKGTHRWLERYARRVLDPWLPGNGYNLNPSKKQYRLEIDIPAPKIDQSDLMLKIAGEGKRSGTITDLEHREYLSAAGAIAGKELVELTEEEMAQIKEERMEERMAAPPNPFSAKMQKAETLAKVIAANPLDPYALASRDKARVFIQQALLDDDGVGDPVPLFRSRHLQGGAGSGNFDHTGRPGEIGGSASGEGETGSGDKGETAKRIDPDKFDMNQWEGKREDWNKLPIGQRDRFAAAKTKIPEYQRELLAPLGEWKNSPDLHQDVGYRVRSAEQEMTAGASNRIELAVTEYQDTLTKAGLREETFRPLVTAATDALIVQEIESQNRQLGDHGAHHITGDVIRGIQILKVVPGEDSPQQVAMLYTAAIFHDTGYLTEPSRALLDEGHPRWSQQHYDENIAPIVESCLGKDASREISNLIRTHDTTTIDWKEDPVGSAMRVSDNTALFWEDKLPPVFRDVDGNREALFEMADGKIDLSELRFRMRENIAKTDMSAGMKRRMYKAVNEVSGTTPKFTLGMLGGTIQTVAWKKDHLVVALRENKDMTRFQKVMDLGQRPFGKFAEAYGHDPAEFKKSLDFQFRNRRGEVVLEGVMVKPQQQGGEGSGNFGHAGRPGEVGGSAPAEGAGSVTEDARNPSTGRYEKDKRERDEHGRYKPKPTETGKEPLSPGGNSMSRISALVGGQVRFKEVKSESARWRVEQRYDPTEIDRYEQDINRAERKSNPGVHLGGLSEQTVSAIAEGLAPLEENGVKLAEISVMAVDDHMRSNLFSTCGAYQDNAGNAIRINPDLVRDNGRDYARSGRRSYEEMKHAAIKYGRSMSGETKENMEASTRWSITTGADLPVEKILPSMINHEAWHAVDREKGISKNIEYSLIKHGVTEKVRYGVSVYAAKGGLKEFVAETGCAIEMGVPIPEKAKNAFLEVCKTLKVNIKGA